MLHTSIVDVGGVSALWVSLYQIMKIQFGMNLASGEAKCRDTPNTARSKGWVTGQRPYPPTPSSLYEETTQRGAGEGGGGVRSLLKLSSGYTPASTGLTNSIYHRKKMKRWRKRLVTSQLNSPSHSRAHPIGRGHSTKSYTRRLRPEVQPITLLYTIFDRNGTHFVYLLLTNDTPFSYLAVRVLHPF